MFALRAPHRHPVTVLQRVRHFHLTPTVLSGHNKWSKIKHKKGVSDIQKGNLYSKASRDILLAARNGGADPEVNVALAAVLKRVRTQGVPKDNIEKALKRAAGGKEKGDQHVVYEVMGPGSIGVMVECLTDNINRTIRTIRSILAQHGARLAPVGFLFDRKGSVCVKVVATSHNSLEPIMEAGLDAGADDFSESDPSEDGQEIEFLCPPDGLGHLTKHLTALDGVELLSSELIYVPKETSDPTDDEAAEKITDFLDALEENEETLRISSTLS